MCAEPAHRLSLLIGVNCCGDWSSSLFVACSRSEPGITVPTSPLNCSNVLMKKGLLSCSVSRHARVGLESVLDDLAIQRAAADREETSGLLLIPRGGLEHANDVGTLRFRQRGQTRGCFGGGCGDGMQELDVRVADDSSGRGERGARDGALQLADVARPGIRVEACQCF